MLNILCRVFQKFEEQLHTASAGTIPVCTQAAVAQQTECDMQAYQRRCVGLSCKLDLQLRHG
jgi:hypothetical protein